MQFDANGKLEVGWGSTVRCFITFSNSVLPLGFQIYTAKRENRTWDNRNGPCYNNHPNDISAIPCEIGLGIYCLALLSLIIPSSRSWNVKYLNLIEDIKTGLQNQFNGELVAFKRQAQTALLRPSFPEMRRVVLTFCRTTSVGICLVVFFLFAQGLAVWSYGSGPYTLNWLIIALSIIWNTQDVVSLWRHDAHLIDGDEQTKWGFGQVLPWVMILSVLLSTVDVISTWYVNFKAFEAMAHIFNS